MLLIVFADASFANNANFSTQFGYCIVLGDRSDRANCLHYLSYKSKRVVRRVLGGELYALADAYDHAYLIRHNLASVFGKWFSLILLTN